MDSPGNVHQPESSGKVTFEKYIELLALNEQLYSAFLRLIKLKVASIKERQINNFQGMILFMIGHGAETVTQLATRGFYSSSNISYNIRKLVELGYITQNRSLRDARIVNIELTPKGRALCTEIEDMLKRQVGELAQIPITPDDLRHLMGTFRRLESILARGTYHLR